MSDNQILEKHNFRHQKKFGQNFLTDVRIPQRIADGCADLESAPRDSEGKAEYLVLEIGPGAGILTKELAKRFKKVIAVEIDENLIPVLAETLADYPNASVINTDIMDVDLRELLEPRRLCDGRKLPVCVCANLPYYITTPVIMKLLEDYDDFSYITVMVQKEVARRLCSKPGGDDYGAITAAINLYGEAAKLFDVSAGNFNPRPKVDSSVVKITVARPPKYSQSQIKNAGKVIKAAFSMRRKTLTNTLSGLDRAGFKDKESLTSLVEQMTGNRSIRGEELSADDFVKLSEKLFNA